MHQPPVTIIMPAFNAQETIERAITSCLNQTFPDFTLLVIDDGSIDNTYQIVSHLASKDPRIFPYWHPLQGGVVNAIETGLVATNDETQYIARMDADDWCHPERIEKQVELLEGNPNLGTASCQIKIIGSESDLTGEPKEGFLHYAERQNSIITPTEHFERRFEESPVCNPTALTRHSVYKALGGIHNPRWAEDYDFWLRHLHRSLTESGFSIAKVPEVLFYWQDGPKRLTRSDARYSEELFLEAKAHYLAQIPAVQKQGVALIGAGAIAKSIGQCLLDRDIPLHSVYDISQKRIGTDFLGHPIQHGSEVPEFEINSPIFLSTIGRKDRRHAAENFLQAKGYVRGNSYYLVA